MNKNSKQRIVETNLKSIYNNSGALPNVRYIILTILNKKLFYNSLHFIVLS